MQSSFMNTFFNYALPIPFVSYPANSNTKSQLKLLLQIATNSRLKQGQDKKNQNVQIFYCKAKGKQCFRVSVDFSQTHTFKILTDYSQIKHEYDCEVKGQGIKTLQIYNLMMLKKDLIENFINQNELISESPQTILHEISGGNEYFYCQYIQELENKRKLKKRFDNVVNISIKKKHIETKIESQQKQIQKQGLQNKIQVFRKPQTKMELKSEFEVQIKPQNNLLEDKTKSVEEKPKNKQPNPQKHNEIQTCEKDKGLQLIEIDGNECLKGEKGDEIFQDKNIYENVHVNNWLEERSQNLSIQYRREQCEMDIIDDIFISMRGNIINSLEKKSLKELQGSIMDKN